APMVTGIRPEAQPKFDLSNIGSTLQVGGYGRVNGTLTVEGGSSITNAELVLKTDTQSINPRRTRYPLGNLEPGESANFDFPIGVNSEADGGPYQLSFVVKYTDSTGTQRKSGRLNTVVDVAKKQRAFSVKSVNATIAPGSKSMIQIKVENIGSEKYTAILPKVIANGPISTYNDNAFVTKLKPGESETFTVGVKAGDSVAEKVYPMALDFRYQNARGSTRISD
ncbi:MAG: hypothetical protein SXQ77_11320, partial [Halobacteria archaeon]|nr:hypothetical protein [Halobacteria archaeon]